MPSSLPPLLRLPPELQLEILTHLPRLDQITTTQVCNTLHRLLSTKLITQTHYVPVSLSGRALKFSTSSETFHSAFPRTHFLLEESSSIENGSLIFTAKAGKPVNYIYVPGNEYTEQEGELWNGDVGALDVEIRDVLMKERQAWVLVSKVEKEKDKEPGPGEPLEIDYEDWNSPTVVFFAENKFISRFTRGRDLTYSSALDQPFISPFILPLTIPNENEEMIFKFKIDIYKDELLEGPEPPSAKKWEEKMVFKRDASVRDWIHKCLEKVYVVAVEKGVGMEEKVWASIQVGRVRNEDAWSVTAAILRVSVEVRREMVWVRRASGHFLLIKKKMWEGRAGWDWDSKKEDGEKDKDKDEEEEENATVSISCC